MQLYETPGYKLIDGWMSSKNIRPFPFQEETWQAVIEGFSGIVNAPTGCGKTFSVFLGALIQNINDVQAGRARPKGGLRLLWISPLRALAKDIGRAMEEVIAETGLDWKVGIRNGDTPLPVRQQQRKNLPEVLIITPESLHLLLAQKNYPEVFEHLRIVCVDEWHELLGSKRGVMTELAISRLIGLRRQTETAKPIQVWGISATIGNLSVASDVLLAPLALFEQQPRTKTIVAQVEKKTEIRSVYPDEIEKYPWAGHLGLRLIHKVIPIIMSSRTTLIFINTRGMSEIWYRSLLDVCPELAGSIALHHGSIEPEIRSWVEENLHSGNLKVVVSTSSLDLGVDFRSVETIIQVGSPKGVARFMQRAGRSGHGPGEISKIFFLPTHSLELAEAAALKQAATEKMIESRDPMLLCFDVLIQYITTLAVSDGLEPDEIFREVKSTFCFADITEEEFGECILFISTGGSALAEYDEYKKAEWIDGRYKVLSRKIAMRHRMHIGTIVSDPMMKVKYLSGGYVGMIEESFISRLNPGDVFTLAGRTLEFSLVKDMTAIVKKSNAKKSIIPSWQGGRMSLTANLGSLLREQIDKVSKNRPLCEELSALEPLFELQRYLSYIPAKDELLIEQIETKDGFHLFVYPFEGRLVHEALAAIIAFRLSRIVPISFSLAMNDYGFELLSDQPIPLDDSNSYEIFSPDNLTADIQHSLNSIEMARRKFRDIASIGGLIFQGYPGQKKKARHLQSSASLLFNVFTEYDPNNLLVRQAYHEAMEQQMEEERLRNTFERIKKSKIIITFPRQLTPFCFPIKVDSMRENLTSEKLEDRIKKMQLMML